MNQVTGVIFCIAYIVGLISTAVSWGGFGILAVGIAAAIALPKFLRKFTQNSVKVAKTRRTRPKENAVSDALDRSEELTFYQLLPRSKWLWFGAGLTGFLASIYFNIRSPQPASNDISKLIPAGGNTEEVAVTVRGRVVSTPRITRSGRSQFWLETNLVSQINGADGRVEVNREVSGKLYVTVPLLQATGLYPENTIAVTGALYKPQPPSNPGAFDFAAYLAREGAFAGLKGRQIDWKRENAIADVNRVNNQNSAAFGESGEMSAPIIYQMRQRIVRSQLLNLNVPSGPLISAIALGKQAVDLPYNIRDYFVQVGLAHAIAASGTQVSMVLALVLALTRRFSKRLQFGFGAGALFLLVGLTGFEASVCRAALMGFGTLFALLLDRSVKPLGLLLIAATILLLVNPLWIWDLGFQLSFLATLGLIVTSPPLMEKLDWMPPAIASIFVVPIAASVWVLPLLLYVFSVVSPYSILVNIIAAPLLWILSIGGMISAASGLIFPPLGSVLAQGLDYPAKGLIAIAQYFSQLPGNSVAVGQVSVLQLIVLYGLICWVWVAGGSATDSVTDVTDVKRKEEGIRNQESGKTRKKQEKGRGKKGKNKVISLPGFSPVLILPVAIVAGIGIVVLPAWHTQASLFQVTLLATSGEPVLVIQDKGKVAIINSGDENTVRFTVLPFLQKQGVNSVNFAIATHANLGLSAGWQKLLERLPIQTFYDNNAPKQIHYASRQELMTAVQSRQGVYFPLEANSTINLGAVRLQFVNAEIPVVELVVANQTWLLFGDIAPSEQKKLVATGTLKQAQVLWWSGKPLTAELLAAVGPKVAIAFAEEIDPETAAQLHQSKTQIFWTGRDGALQWTPAAGFKTTLESEENQTSFL